MPLALMHPRTTTSGVWQCAFCCKTLPFGKRSQANNLSGASMCNMHCSLNAQMSTQCQTLQTEIMFSTLEAEYITLSTAMHKLIQLRTVLFKIKNIFGFKISNNLLTNGTVFWRQLGLVCLGHNWSSTFKIIGHQVPFVLISFVWRLDNHQGHQNSMSEGWWLHQPLPFEAFLPFCQEVCGWVTQSRARVEILISC